MKLIENWRSAWRMLSVQVASIAIAFGLLPQESQAAMLEAIGVPSSRITAVLGAMMLVGRLIYQPGVERKQDSGV